MYRIFFVTVLGVGVALFGCGKKGPQNSGEASLDDLNRALSVMSMGGAQRPADVNALTNFPTLRGKSLPKPPAGKKLAIAPARQQVVFVDE